MQASLECEFGREDKIVQLYFVILSALHLHYRIVYVIV